MNKIIATILMVSAGLPFSALAKETIGDYVLEFDSKVEADTDVNGENDRTSYYLDDRLVWSAFDTDEDGEPDLWLRYKNGDTVDLEISDPDGDGEPDRIAEYDSSGKREVIYDSSAEFADSSTSWTSTIILAVIALIAGAAGYKFLRRK